jgi:hypothetical protein
MEERIAKVGDYRKPGYALREAIDRATAKADMRLKERVVKLLRVAGLLAVDELPDHSLLMAEERDGGMLLIYDGRDLVVVKEPRISVVPGRVEVEIPLSLPDGTLCLPVSGHSALLAPAGVRR